LLFINPTEKNPYVFHVCGNHGNLRFGVLNFAEAEVQTLYDRNQIKWDKKRDRMSEIWKTCKRCNEPFTKEDVIWVIQYIKLSNDIQLSTKKPFRVHKDCALREMTLYGFGKKEADKEQKLDLFS